MDKDEIYRVFQEICRQIPVIILGSGPSCAVGIPSMKVLAEYLLHEMKGNNNDKWRIISDDLRKGMDFESALQRTSPDESLHNEIVKIVGPYISEADLKVREQYLSGLRITPIESLIKYYYSWNLSIITPNYDCLVEYCCDKLKIQCRTGFVGYFMKRFDLKKADRVLEYIDRSVINGKQKQIRKVSPHVSLFKVHGSIDWYEIENEKVVDMSLRYCRQFDDKRLIIPPGDRKFQETHKIPFREIIQKADDSIRSGKSFLMIGYGFNDKHLEELLVQRLKDDEKSGIIITKKLSMNAVKLLSDCPNLWGVYQKNSSTVIRNKDDEYEINDTELWKIDEFVRHVLGG